MSSKSSNSSRQSSPRAMPVETIITRFKSAQQKRKLREMDRSMSKITKLLRNPLKSKTKRKAQVPMKNNQKSNNILSVRKEIGEQKKMRKNKPSTMEKVDIEKEFCPLKLKRQIVLNKIQLKPRHELKIIAQTNKRKRTSPRKGIFSQDYLDITADTKYIDVSKEVTCKKMKYQKAVDIAHDTSMVEMIQIMEENGSLDDEDFLEILTCPSPVWWEDPPDGYNEDALFSRPRSTSEMYPSVKTQLQENAEERKRSKTPNILSRRVVVNSKQVATVVVGQNEVKDVLNNTSNVNIDKKKDNDELISSNDNNIDVRITLSGCDEKFIKKRSKLEMVLGNLKDRNVKNHDTSVNSDVKCKISDNNTVQRKVVSSDNSALSNMSFVEKIGSKEEVKDKEVVDDLSCVELDTKEISESVSAKNESERTDDENMTEISLQDEAYLDNLENMNIPMERNVESPNKETIDKEKNILQHIKKETVEVDNNSNMSTENSYLGPSYKYETNYSKENTIDPTYSGKESSVIEDFLEVKLFEVDDAVVSKELNEYSKSKVNSRVTNPIEGRVDCKNKEKKLSSSINIKMLKKVVVTKKMILNSQSTVPKNLPPLMNSDVRKGNVRCIGIDCKNKEKHVSSPTNIKMFNFDDTKIHLLNPVSIVPKNVPSLINSDIQKGKGNTPSVGIDCKNKEKNLLSSINIKMLKKNYGIEKNVLNTKSTVPKKLPSLINSDVRKGNVGGVPENLPPLIPNPENKVNLDSSKSNKSSSSLDTCESFNASSIQDNMDSISDTNVCFLNEDEDDCDINKNNDNSAEFESISITNCNILTKSTELLSNDSNLTREDNIPINESKNITESASTTNLINNTHQNVYETIMPINPVKSNENNDLEFPGLKKAKLNDSCSKLKSNASDVNLKKNYERHGKEHCNDADDLDIPKTESCVDNDSNARFPDNIKTIEKYNSESIPIFKTLQDSSSYEENKNYLVRKTNTELSTEDDSIVNSDNSRDKMVFYYKKWKNTYWRDKNTDVCDNKQIAGDEDVNSFNNDDKNLLLDNNKVNNISRKRKLIADSELDYQKKD